MRYSNIPTISDGLANVIIETPAGSRNKFDFDPDIELFSLNKTLPMGTVFPFDFGFIPNTKAEDGDPVDILVIMDGSTWPGILVQCRLIGILKAWQKERTGTRGRNDRLIGVADCSVMYSGIKDIKDLNRDIKTEIENFFIDYNAHAGKKFTPIKWEGSAAAMKKIKKFTQQ